MRFPEFSGEWERCTLGDFGNVITGNTPPTAEYENFDNGTHLWASPADLGTTKYIESTQTLLSDRGFEKSRSFPANSILVTCIGSTIGKMGMSKTEMASNQQINTIVPVQHDANFVYYAVQSRFPRYLSSIAVQAVPILSKSSFEKLTNYTTARKEQIKIGNLLSLIDERIDTQKKIIEDLKKLKDAIAEKLFCCPDDESPELRVENSSDRWNLYRLKDVCQRVSERNSQGLSSLVLTIAAQYGLVSETDFFNKSVASENLSNYYLIRKGDFAYNKSYSGEYAWGAVKRLELYEKGVLSPLYICFRPNPLIVYSDFLSHYFETHKWHNGIAQIAGEGARNHGLLNISISDFFETIHRFPELPEQQRIASYLNSLSDKISLANKVLESYTRQKRYLLARMFI